MAFNDGEQSWDDVTIFIKENLQKTAPFVPECSIHRVPKALLDMNPNAYVPRNISIGPFHCEKNCKATEELKLRFFNSYQCRVGMSVEDIVKEARGWEKTARAYYSESTNYMDSKEFVKMMVLDGCFIVEFMIMNRREFEIFPGNENKVHYSFYKAIEYNISVELIMLENQLPFCVLQNLFDLILSKSNDTYSINNIELFRVVVHSFLHAKVMPNSIKNRVKFCDDMLNQSPHHLLEFLSSYFVPKNEINVEHHEYCAPPSATKLSEAGVVFKSVQGNEICFMDISFKDGILNIPPIIIDDSFETWARNLLAFTQFSWEESVHIKGNVLHYFTFLDDLITTEKDVSLLVKDGIIINNIGGSEKEIEKLFNDICKNIIVSCTNCFSKIARDLKQHCERRRNQWMASLRRNYFNTPWALISFLAATFLIILTVLQTVFSGISTKYK